MATVDCPHSNPFWFWLTTQQAAIRHSIIVTKLNFLVSSYSFSSRIWGVYYGFLRLYSFTDSALRLITRWYPNAVKIWTESCQICNQLGFSSKQCTTEIAHRASTPLVKFMPLGGRNLPMKWSEILTRRVFFRIRYVFLRRLAFYSGTFRRWYQWTNGTYCRWYSWTDGTTGG